MSAGAYVVTNDASLHDTTVTAGGYVSESSASSYNTELSGNLTTSATGVDELEHSIAYGTKIYSGGEQGVGEASITSDTIIYSGGEQDIGAAESISTTVESGGLETTAIGGGSENTVVNNGGVELVYSAFPGNGGGITFGGKAFNTIVNSGGSEILQGRGLLGFVHQSEYWRLRGRVGLRDGERRDNCGVVFWRLLRMAS